MLYQYTFVFILKKQVLLNTCFRLIGHLFGLNRFSFHELKRIRFICFSADFLNHLMQVIRLMELNRGEAFLKQNGVSLNDQDIAVIDFR